MRLPVDLRRAETFAGAACLPPFAAALALGLIPRGLWGARQSGSPPSGGGPVHHTVILTKL